MSFFSFFNRGHQSTSGSTGAELPAIYSLSLKSEDFIRSDLLATYTKILTDVVERMHGLPKEKEPLLWDNCVQSEATVGLVTFLAEAMVSLNDLFLVYIPSVKVLRKADPSEQAQITADYKKSGESSKGIYISFKRYRRTEMLKIYSELEYCVLASLYKTVNISKAVQVKISELRKSVSLADADKAVAQGVEIADALRAGLDVMLDAGDTITTSTPEIGPTEKAIGFLDAKKSFILGLPIAYVTGLQTGGLGSTGEADMRAVERGLKQYFVSIIQPVVQKLFDCEVTFKSQDFRQITSALETLKTFELVSDDLLSLETKRQIMARLFEVDPDEEARAIAKAKKAKPINPQALAPANSNFRRATGGDDDAA